MDENISIWLVGNTGLRSPDRIQDGLQVFAQSPYVGNGYAYGCGCGGCGCA